MSVHVDEVPLARPVLGEAEERAVVEAMLRRGLRHDHLDELRRLGFPLD